MSPANKLLGGLPAFLSGRLAPGSGDTVGITLCRLLALPLVECSIALRLAPSAVTTASGIIFFAGLERFWAGEVRMAGLGVALGALLDFVDGMLARRTGRCTVFGYRYDYLLDRCKSVGLFATGALLASQALLAGVCGIAFVLIGIRELLLWVVPLRQATNVCQLAPWSVLFPFSGWLIEEVLRNDPWQLVMLGLSAVISGLRGWEWGLSFYAISLLVDSAVLLRSFLNIGRTKVAGARGLFLRGADGAIKAAVAHRLFGPPKP